MPRRVQMTRYGLTPGQVQYLPAPQIAAIAAPVDDVTRNPDLTRDQRTAQMAVMATEMYSMFGEYADEVLVNVIDFMNNGPLEDTPEAGLFRALTRGTERDPSDPRPVPLGDAPPFVDAPDQLTEVDPEDEPDVAVTPSTEYELDTPEGIEQSARQAAAEAQRLTSARERSRFIRSLPAELRERVRELLL